MFCNVGELASTKARDLISPGIDEWLELGPEYDDLEPTADVPITELRIVDSPRSSGENVEHVKMLAEVSGQLPPILVHYPTMRVIDGLHRLRAAKSRGQSQITVKFFHGDEADAFVLAVKCNVTHGLPLSIGDRKSAAERIISSHREWSDRAIASIAGLSPKTVAEIRLDSERESTSPVLRVGQDGRVRPINSAEGRRLASDVIAANPHFSLRQIAKAAGISPETARDVRNRLVRGEDPVPDRRRATRSTERGPSSGAIAHTGVNWPETARRLSSDPALRLSENGRVLLRLLFMHLIEVKGWEQIADSVPPHCSDIVAGLAQECGRIWYEFADGLKRRSARIPSN